MTAAPARGIPTPSGPSETEIELEPFSRRDFRRLIGWIHSADELMIWGGWAFHFPLDESQLTRYLRFAERFPARRRVFRAVDPGSRDVIGHIELNEIDRANGSARVCRVLVGEAEQRGRGVGQAMLRQILALAFGDLGLHRVDLGVFDFNLAAIACYEKVGFAHEGRFRDARRMPGGRYWSVLQMSILEDEWRRNSAARA